MDNTNECSRKKEIKRIDEGETRRKIQEAIALLKAHGYTIKMIRKSAK